jgi:hypothetical protein
MEGAVIHEAAYGPAPPPRSKALGAIGVLGVVFGVLVAVQQVSCIALYGVGQQLHGIPADKADLARAVQLDMGLKGVVTLMALALIGIGVGLRRHREAARKAMVAWSILALLVVAGRTATEALAIQPATIRHQRALLAKSGHDRGEETLRELRRSSSVLVWSIPFVWTPFPLTALLLLTRRSVRERCS